MKKRSGFTLVELLIVMAVLAILVGIAIPAFQGMREQGNNSRAEGDLRTLANALESYFGTNNRYPAAAAWQADLYAASPRVVQKQNYYDPYGATTTTRYSYLLSANTKYYVAFSIGKDATADITAISDAGLLTGGPDDDKYVSNGSY